MSNCNIIHIPKKGNHISISNTTTSRNIESEGNGTLENVYDQVFNFKHKGFHIVNLNVHHLLRKLDEIKFHLLKTARLHVIGYCETFLNNDVDDRAINIPNYTFERKDRTDKQGGGIVVYISENVSYIRRYDIECTNIESIWIQLNKSNKQQFLINIVYRPPRSTQAWIDLYETQLESADRLSLECYVLGEINIQYTPSMITQNMAILNGIMLY